MNKLSIFIGIVLAVVLIVGAISLLNKNGSPTTYIVKEPVSQNVSQSPAPVTGNAVAVIAPVNSGPVVLSLANGNDINLGYMPKTLTLKDLQSGVSIKLGTIEFMVGPKTDTTLTLAVSGVNQNTNNVIMTDELEANYNTPDGNLNFLYESKFNSLTVYRLTNPDNYPDAK